MFWKDPGGILLNFLTEEELRAFSLSFKRVYVEVTMLGEPLHKRSLDLIITGPLYFLM
jgi:hypothetical protein